MGLEVFEFVVWLLQRVPPWVRGRLGSWTPIGVGAVLRLSPKFGVDVFMIYKKDLMREKCDWRCSRVAEFLGLASRASVHGGGARASGVGRGSLTEVELGNLHYNEI